MKNNIISKWLRINFQFLFDFIYLFIIIIIFFLRITNLCCLLLDWDCDMVIVMPQFDWLCDVCGFVMSLTSGIYC